jgi:GTP-binding protein LepA
MVFSGVYPIDTADYDNLRAAMEKLQLNDSAFSYVPETSDALGFGFRCGYLGLLHMEVVQERLEREYDLDLINTSPSVVYKVLSNRTGETIEIHSPSKLPPLGEIAEIQEPVAKVTLHLPGTQKSFEYTGPGRVIITYDVPYAEVVYDFFDKLKGVSKGYASMDYDVYRWEAADLVKLDILVNGEQVDALSCIVHREQSFYKGQQLTRKLKEFIPRQMWEVAIQAAIGAKVIARTNVKALRKDVTAKCYGGDISRKRKLSTSRRRQERMKSIAPWEIPRKPSWRCFGVGDD